MNPYTTSSLNFRFPYTPAKNTSLFSGPFLHPPQSPLLTPPLSTTRALTLLATQHPTTKRNPKDSDFTVIQLILIRLVSQETDIVISVNVPHVPGENRDQDVDVTAEKMATAKGIRDQILQTFEVRDWGLFGE